MPNHSDDPVVVLDDVTKTYRTRDRTVHALDHLSLTVHRGELLGVLGPNGAGKTTAVNVLATLTRPDSGTATVAGHDVVTDPAGVRDAISLTGQFAAVDGELTGLENLVLFGRLRGMTKKDATARARELLASLSLSDVGGSLVRTYSGGMRRRLDIAVSVMTVPEVLFLDEPTTGLDPAARRELWDVVRDLNRQGVTIVLTTQYLEEADELADRIVVIDHGTVIAEGTADELKDRLGPTELLLTPDHEGDAAALTDLLTPWDARTTAPGSVPGAEPGGTVTVPLTEGAKTAAAVMQAVGAAGVPLSGMSMTSHTLDDVFFSLTEHGAE
ncbi:ATP-binding cassette domain-containing protein [Corynebacterium nuruki]|uniref:ATP-binding cassette domain-containing protein n=1 Tax=Corynebacterium nuruki TaxID=1032851 RepID=UPI0039BFEEB2